MSQKTIQTKIQAMIFYTKGWTIIVVTVACLFFPKADAQDLQADNKLLL